MLNFPTDYNKTEGKTIVYLIAFDSLESEDFFIDSNSYLMLNGSLVSDDIFKYSKNLSLDEFVSNQMTSNHYNDLYFPNYNDEFFDSNEIEKYLSIPLQAIISIGMIDTVFEDDEMSNWVAGFEDLTEKGKQLYYMIKELYHDKEVRILTFIK
ncbi:MAG: hypothetical protein SLAVMIC_00747 [uncultured marine phage]|uniref:Uncharacterized protein n=1 Tax=uncultured marine phage TaxID=707152 RepID=A0A8D9FRC5_9VIRU|nr:MAG: hypothetical protein SLAVMIC_00747 [uncultured marine phage]